MRTQTVAGKRVLVTGGGAGIGKDITRTLHRAGAEVAVHYNSSRGPAEALKEELGDRIHVIGADLSDRSAPPMLWEQTVERMGGIDVLVNNAGAWTASPVEPKSAWDAGWEMNLSLNLLSAADLSRCAVEHFRSSGEGAIISITSRSAHRGDDGEHLAYGVAKAGLQNLMKGIARAFGPEVLAYSIAPGWVDTELAAGSVDPETLAQLPLREITPPSEVAELVAFLASGKSRHLTGATLDVTGADYVR